MFAALVLVLSQDSIAWEKDHAAALARGKDEKKFVLVVFETAWCGMCNRMAAETFADAGVVEALRAFVCVRLDPDKSEKLWRETYAGSVHPSLFLVTGEGEILSRLPDFREAKSLLQALKALPERVKKLREAQAKGGDAGLLEMAAARTELSDSVGAAAVLDKVLDKGTDDKLVAMAAAKLAQIRSDEEKWQDVERLAEVFDKRDKGNATGLAADLVLPRVFAAFLGRQDAEGALKKLREAMAAFESAPVMDRWMFLEGAILREKGQLDAAKAVWKQLAEKFPASDWGKRAKREVER